MILLVVRPSVRPSITLLKYLSKDFNLRHCLCQPACHCSYCVYSLKFLYASTHLFKRLCPSIEQGCMSIEQGCKSTVHNHNHKKIRSLLCGPNVVLTHVLKKCFLADKSVVKTSFAYCYFYKMDNSCNI